MAVEIPWVRINRFALRPRLFSSEQEGVLGGPDLSNPRVGDRWIVDVGTTHLIYNAACRTLLASLMRAGSDGAVMAIRQPDLPAPAIGATAVVDGAGQTGRSLAVRAMQPGGTVRYGQFFSILHAGTYFTYMAAPPETLTVPATGRLTVPIWPMLRAITIDGSVSDFDEPKIEGALVGFDKGKSFVRNRMEPVNFSIRERR